MAAILDAANAAGSSEVIDRGGNESRQIGGHTTPLEASEVHPATVTESQPLTYGEQSGIALQREDTHSYQHRDSDSSEEYSDALSEQDWAYTNKVEFGGQERNSTTVLGWDNVDNREIGEDDFLDIRKAVCDLTGDWRDFGYALGFTPSIMKGISEAHPSNPGGSLFDLLYKWVRKDFDSLKFSSPSWRTLVRAVANGGGNPALAEKIAQAHPVAGVQTASNALSTNCSGWEHVDDSELDDHFHEIKLAVGRDLDGVWREFSSALGFSPSAIKGVAQTHPGNPGNCMFDILDKWVRKDYNHGKFGPPSWKTLVKAVASNVGGQNFTLAEKIAQVHHHDNPMIQTDQSFQKVQQSLVSRHTTALPAQCGCGRCAYTNVYKVPQNGINFPFIDTSNMSKSERDALFSRLTDEKDGIFNEFDLLMEEYNTWLKTHQVALEMYQDVLQNISGFEALLKDNNNLLEDRKKEIRAATDFRALGDIICDYVNWFSHSLLSTIIDRIGRKINTNTDDFKGKVDKYKSALQDFCQRSIYECPMPCTLSSSNKYIKYLCMKVQMPKSDKYSKLKATKIDKFVADISKVFGLSSHTLKLCSVAEGCVEVLFSIPSSIHVMLFPLQNDILNHLVPLGVIKICTDGYVIERDKDSKCFHQILNKENSDVLDSPENDHVASESEVQTQADISQMDEGCAATLIETTQLVTDKLAEQTKELQVFIAYAHNPEEYTQLQPPEGAERETSQAFFEKAKQHEETMRDGIRQHEQLVKTLATFLIRNGVNAKLDQYITDEGTDNRMKWAQKEIEGSQFVILVISKSFLPFLEGKPRPPVNKECIFSSDYLYNKIHFPGEGGPKFLPVFLNQKKDLSLLPKALMASSVYEIHEKEISVMSPLDTSKCSEGLLSLYCRITGQNRYSLPVIGAPVIPIPLVRIPFGPKPGMTEQQRTKFNCLSKVSDPLSKTLQSKLAENEAFSKHWQDIGSKLGLTQVELAQCEQHGGDTSEQCYLMFEQVRRRTGEAGVSVAKLAEAARQIEQFQLFEVIQM